MCVLIYALRSRSNGAGRSGRRNRSAHAGEDFPRRRFAGGSPERCYALPKRRGTREIERGGDGESYRGTRGDGEARRRLGDGDPRRRRWLVAERTTCGSEKLGKTSNGLRWTRRSSWWRPTRRRGAPVTARRRPARAAVGRWERA